jgi:pimeloyl-ACP methyl ester carboxylesterase
MLPLLLTGCSAGIHVCRLGNGKDPLAQGPPGPFTDEVPSAPTLEAMRRRGIDGVGPASLKRLREEVEREPRSDALFALAELSYRLGRQADKVDVPDTASAYYYLSAGFAYHFLFGPGSVNSPFDGRFRLACELYNAAVVQCLRAAVRVQPIEPGREMRLPIGAGGEIVLPIDYRGFPWYPEEIGPACVCADYKVVGLRVQRISGLGAPVILRRQNAKDVPRARSARYPQTLGFPGTALVHFPGAIAELHKRHGARLEVIDPLALPEVEIAGQTVSLESDTTTPLAWCLGQSEFSWWEFTSFFHPDELHEKAGLYLLEPYQPGKIPLVLIHGILSSPMSWGSMVNALRADPVLRKRYQVWLYYYPTANHFLVTAARLREELARLRAELGSDRDPALDNMVLMGHSQGGIIARLLTVAGGDDFWRLISNQPFTALPARPAFERELREAFFFQPQPYVKRVVMLATPNHGSQIIRTPPLRLLRPFIRDPAWLEAGVEETARLNPYFFREGGLPTTLDLLAPGAPFLEVLAARPRGEGVHYHTVMGAAATTPIVTAERLLAGSGWSEPDDGIVPCSSARLEGVDSERVVPAEHTEVLVSPQVFAEVRRILLEHK